MKTKAESRRTRFLAPCEIHGREPAVIVFDEEEHVPSSEHVVMDQARELPALQEYLREYGSRAIH